MEAAKRCFVVNGMTDFVCSKCFHTKRIKVGDRGGELRVKCQCKSIEKLILNRRRSIRKKVALLGYIQSETRRAMTVSDISLGGLSASINGAVGLSEGDKVEVTFFVNIKGKEEEIKTKAIVRSIRDDGQIGFEFVELDDFSSAKKKLGFFLM